MALNDWEFKYKGYTFGGENDIAIVDVQGLLDLPNVVVTNHALLRRNGLVPGDPFLRGRTLSFVVDLHADNEVGFTSLISAIRDMTSPLVDESEMTLKVPSAFGGAEARLFGRVVRRQLSVDLPYLYRNTEVRFDFFCSYPVVESVSEQTVSMVLGTEAGGRTYGRTYNLTYGTAATGGTYTVTNPGNIGSDFVVTFEGPLTTPKLTLAETGEYLEFDITLASGQQLLVDTKSRTVLLEGTASRINTLTEGSTWWKVPVSVTGTSVIFTAQAAQAGTAELVTRAAYL